MTSSTTFVWRLSKLKIRPKYGFVSNFWVARHFVCPTKWWATCYLLTGKLRQNEEQGRASRQLERLFQDRNAWGNHVDGLCSRSSDGIDWLIIDWVLDSLHVRIGRDHSRLQIVLMCRFESCLVAISRQPLNRFWIGWQIQKRLFKCFIFCYIGRLL